MKADVSGEKDKVVTIVVGVPEMVVVMVQGIEIEPVSRAEEAVVGEVEGVCPPVTVPTIVAINS